MRVLARPRAHAGAAARDAGRRSGSRRWATTASPRCPAMRRTACTSREAKMLTTEGRPYDGTEIRILGPARRAAARRRRSATSSSTARAASCSSSATSELTRESLTGWGGYRTGDLGYLDEDGHLVYVGRSKDIIRRGGVTVVPAEVEPVLMRHPAVHEAAVVPLPDERLGERACAALILKPGAAGADARRAAGVPRARGRRQVHVARIDRGLRRVPAHAVAEGGQARGRRADRRPRAAHGAPRLP